MARFLPMGAPSLALIVVGVLAVSACAEDRTRPSLVEGLRVLGLRFDPPMALPGEPLTFEVLWADPLPLCSAGRSCPAGQSCEQGQCVRDASTELAWLVLPRIALEAAGDLDLRGTTEQGCALGSCPAPPPCSVDSDCPPPFARCREGSCLPCFSAGPVTFCCGQAGQLAQIDTVAPAPQAAVGCDDPAAVDLALGLEVQVQVCAGGQIDLCVEEGGTRFGCDGEGAETAVAASRVPVRSDASWPNTQPSFGELTLDGQSWDEQGAPAVIGCLEADCADRACEDPGDCHEGQVCSNGRCREEIQATLGPGAVETYLEECDASAACGDDADCRSGWVCEEQRCLRVESPLVSFFATTGSFDPGRAGLDEDGDLRPDLDAATTEWTPPVLEPCDSPDSPCAFGACDLAAGRCVGDVSFWMVVRDGRGGQAWLERQLRVVP